ncbi:hypothetical protein CJD38_11880 [Stenotrophobium rhamnosiphilum]|uniref:Cellulose biosynthesis protein BcsF n=1 Tax=Stenotrophobium rhamnosiphilum TaxID=2029166 RepID=A0A2T5MEJ8_9GAMM|nr:hypothetical protein CJD38_11880 [Stenotrophobium rhamnosiphilum]
MNFILLNLYAFLPLIIGLLLAIPLYLLFVYLVRNRTIRLWLFRHRLIRRQWQPVFMTRYTSDKQP